MSEISDAYDALITAEVALKQAKRDYQDAQFAVKRAQKKVLDQPKIGSVIQFSVQYKSNPTNYVYVAYRAPDGAWYITGDEVRHSWDHLLTLMRRDQYTQQCDGKVRYFLFGVDKGPCGKWVGRNGS
jgi:hypothetical protein